MDATLYHLESCPYCARVRGFIAHRGLERYIRYREVSQDHDALERLVESTRRTQVPVLETDGDAIVGGDCIIDWLDENAVALARGPDARSRHRAAREHRGSP
jgi:glutaredoxin